MIPEKFPDSCPYTKKAVFVYGPNVSCRRQKFLHEKGIPCSGHSAHQITRSEYDHIIIMDNYNRRNLERVTGPDKDGKVSRLRDFTSSPGEIADPWYTRDFNLTYRQVTDSCRALLETLIQE